MMVKANKDLNWSNENVALVLLASLSIDVCPKWRLGVTKLAWLDRRKGLVMALTSLVATLGVGLVKSIIVRKSEVFFIVKKYKAEMQSQLHFFICSATRDDFVTVSVKNLKDTYPLMKRGTEEKFVIIQHHHISFENA